MHRFSDEVKVDVGLVSQALNNANATGQYFPMAMWRQIMAILNVGVMAATKTAQIELLQAQDASGTGAKAIPPLPATELATATIAANTNVTGATLTLAAVVATNAVTVNGVTFTAVAVGAVGTQFNVGANDTATAANLAAAINAAGLGVTATPNATVVTLAATSPGDTLVTVTNPAATITVATTQALAFIDLDVSQLDTANGFSYVAAKVTTTANTTVAVTLARAMGRYCPINQYQKVGAGAVV